MGIDPHSSLLCSPKQVERFTVLFIDILECFCVFFYGPCRLLHV